MKTSLTLLASVAFLGLSLTAHAADITYTLSGGTFSPTGTFSGTFLLDPSTAIIDGGSITATDGVNTYSFVNSGSDSPIPGLAFFSDASGDTFRLAIDGLGGSSFAINTVGLYSQTGDTQLNTADGGTFDATGATVATAPNGQGASAAATPEPSSLMLLGTGALGMAGALRRRFLKAL